MILDVMPRADRQIRAARRWWLQNRDKAPEAFDEELDRVFELIESHPYIAPAVRVRQRMVRRYTIERIRYYLYYRVEKDYVRVLSLWHTSRRPPRL